MDETYIKIKGQWYYLYRTVDKYGETIGFLLTEHRDTEAALCFLKGVLVKRGQLTRPSLGVSRTLRASRIPGSLPMAEIRRCPQVQSLALGMCQLLPPS